MYRQAGHGSALILLLVLQGIKRATAASVWALQAEGKQPPKPGDLSIVTDWGGQPLCIIETEAVEIVPFDEVTAFRVVYQPSASGRGHPKRGFRGRLRA